MWVFEAAYKEHFQSVFRYALRHAGLRHWAEDITSDTFLALYRNRQNVEEAQLPAWLFTVARNRAIDYWRQRSKEEAFEGSVNETATHDSADLTAFNEMLGHPSLKPVHRVCLVMRFVHGMSREEIARETGMKESQVKGHLQYALKLLRKSMSGSIDNHGEHATAR
jgi:RNA polymerase sigma-70 factor (ECF subfamily)